MDGLLYGLAYITAAVLGAVLGHYSPPGPSWSDIWRWIRRD